MTVPRVRTRSLLCLLALLVLGAGIPHAQAAPARRTFGPYIEDHARYEGQTKCRRKAKKGVKGFRRIVMNAYPGTRDFGITRGCEVGGRSEHKEGRAWDWGVDASSKKDRRKARTLLRWLLETDPHGNEHAMARRLGVMYVIWNREIWSTWSGEWRTYCVQKRRKCKNEDGEVRHPHDDHVHFSFSWDGARKRTSFWNKELSYTEPVEEPPPAP